MRPNALRRAGRGGWARWILGLVVAGLLALRFGNDTMRLAESRRASVSHGTPDNGSLDHGKRLPTAGPNYRAYSLLGALLGRNSVNSRVRATVIDAYAAVAKAQPDVQWVYGETGWPRGGPFPPHKTHENGLSVDFMVPVRDRTGHPSRLPTWPWRKFGYSLEFDSTGHGTGSIDDLVIDFPAIAAHLVALADAAPRHGLAVDVVIFAPELERRLIAAPGGDQLRGRVRFTRRPPWVRHDEHYHVNFRVLHSERAGVSVRLRASTAGTTISRITRMTRMGSGGRLRPAWRAEAVSATSASSA